MLLSRATAAALRPGALRSLSQQGQSGRIFAARVAGAHRPQALVRHRSSDSGIVQSVLRHLSTATPDDDGGQAQGHPRDGRPSLFSKKTVDFAAVLEEYEHPTPARISQKNQRRRFSEFSNETLAVMASLGVHGASKERMLREIMRVDGCSYVEAYAVLAKMNLHLEGGTSLHKLPYQAIIAGAWALGVVLYEILHGRPPFYGSNLEQLETRIRAVSHAPFDASVSAGASSRVRKCGGACACRGCCCRRRCWQYVRPVVASPVGRSIGLLPFQALRRLRESRRQTRRCASLGLQPRRTLHPCAALRSGLMRTACRSTRGRCTG